MRRSLVAAVAAALVIGVPASVGAVPTNPGTEPGANPGANPAAEVSAAPRVPVRTLRPARLKRGPDARMVTLQNGVIRRPGAAPIRFRVAHDGDRQILLGAHGGGYLVASERGRWHRVHRITAGKKPVLVTKMRISRERHREYVGFRLSRTGESMARHVLGSYAAHLTLWDPATGVKQATWPSRDHDLDRFLDLSGGKVWAGEDDHAAEQTSLVEWTPGAAPVAVSAHAPESVLAHRDLAFVGSQTSNANGPIALSAPGDPAWRANFHALDVSRDGELVIGTRMPKGDRSGRQVLEVRQMSDGTLIQAFRYGSVMKPGRDNYDDFDQTVRFESNTKFVFQMDSGRKKVLVRCTTSGRCNRASATGGGLSVPFESYEW